MHPRRYPPGTLPPYEDYVRVWKGVMIPLFNWSDTQVERWALKFKKFFDGKTHEFHHNGPIWYVAEELISRKLRDWVRREHRGLELRDMLWKINGIIERFMDESACPSEILRNKDWSRVKSDIDAVLREHGETFENAVAEKRNSYLEP